MTNPYTFDAYDFRFTARWQPDWPTILGRLNLVLERLDWCRYELLNAAPGSLPTGYYDDPLPIGGGYLWHDPGGHCFRVNETIPASASDGQELGMGGTT